MDIANLFISIGTFIGIWLMYYYQRSKISSLKTTIDSQKAILDSAQQFISIFDIDRVKKYVEMNEDTIKKETELKVREVEKRSKEELNKQVNILQETIQRIAKWYGAAFVILESIRPVERQVVINRIDDEDIRNELIKLMKDFKMAYNPPQLFPHFMEALFGNSEKAYKDSKEISSIQNMDRNGQKNEKAE
jgi:hypothetical protein